MYFTHLNQTSCNSCYSVVDFCFRHSADLTLFYPSVHAWYLHNEMLSFHFCVVKEQCILCVRAYIKKVYPVLSLIHI